MSNMKKYLITAVVLGSIAMASGLLIGATNLLTSGPIAAYEKNQINNGIKEIFSVHSVPSENARSCCGLAPAHPTAAIGSLSGTGRLPPVFLLCRYRIGIRIPEL